MPPPPAIVDASVLYSRHLRNTLVWHSLEGLFELRWSEFILDEVRRSLIERNLDAYGEERALAVDRVLERMTSALNSVYADAEVPAEQIQSLVEQMTNHPKDRHVLAAAVVAKAPFILTLNLKDFRFDDTHPHGIEALSPDAFLTKLLDDEQAVELCSAALAHQADFHGWTIAELLTLLSQPSEHRPAWLPRYARLYKRLTAARAKSPEQLD
jgi:predicted nucleic acid-binding protein